MIIAAVTVFGWVAGNMHEHCVIVHQPFACDRADPIIRAIFNQLRERANIGALEFEREGLHIAIRWEDKEIVKTNTKEKGNGQANKRDKGNGGKRIRKVKPA